jgi:hypothetical protein
MIKLTLPLILVLIIGGYLIYVAIKTDQKECPPQKIEYRLVPRTFQQEQQDPVKPSEIFSSMFNNNTLNIS